MQSSEHADALRRFEDGDVDGAIAVLRGRVREALDPEVANDLAVMLAGAGEVDEARDLLVALRRLFPAHEAAAENLQALPARRAHASLSEETSDRRARFLALVTDALDTHLPDNMDFLFAPWGYSVPERGGVGARLAAELAVLDRSDVIWSQFGDEASRELFLRLLAYRALGPAHVRLQLEPLEYRRAVLRLTASMAVEVAAHRVPGAPMEWQFHRYDLADGGFPLSVIAQPLPLASTFVFSQYAYREPRAGAVPKPGDVALDVGGCWGETALWLAHMVGERGHVHTFEPSPANRELLAANLALNPDLARRVTVWPVPVGARAGEQVRIENRMSPGAVVEDDPAVPRTADTVDVVSASVDDLVAQGAIERVDFLKVDVEGADLGVLQGAAETIRAHRPRLAIACYHRPDDLVVIPDHVAALGVPYAWYLQCSTMTDADTVAFAVPA